METDTTTTPSHARALDDTTRTHAHGEQIAAPLPPLTGREITEMLQPWGVQLSRTQADAVAEAIAPLVGRTAATLTYLSRCAWQRQLLSLSACPGVSPSQIQALRLYGVSMGYVTPRTTRGDGANVSTLVDNATGERARVVAACPAVPPA
jgi:hypothetical protein